MEDNPWKNELEMYKPEPDEDKYVTWLGLIGFIIVFITSSIIFFKLF